MSQLTQDPSLSPASPAAVRIAPSIVPPATAASLERIERLLEQLTGVAPRQPTAAGWAHLLALPPATQQLIVKAWDDQAAFLEGAVRAGLKANDEIGMLNYALGKLNLLGDSSLVNEIRPGDIIEIANAEYVQIYRSYSYFAVCNYSLVELSAYPWYELYERSANVTKLLVDAAEGVFTGKVSRVSFEHVPEYTIRELMTEERSAFLLKERFGVRLVSPVTGENYALSVKSVKQLATDTPATRPGNLHFI